MYHPGRIPKESLVTDTRRPAPLLGLAIGDALGGPFETKHFTAPELVAWNGSFRTWEINDLQPDRNPGDWTDDTKAALALATALVEAETYNPVVVMAKYMEWYESGDLRGMGDATKQAFQRILQGYHWDQSGVPDAEGNGTAMRSAPIGAFYHRNLLSAANMARIDASLTHKALEAEEGSAAVALATALLCDGYVKEDVLPATIALLRHSRVQEGLAQLQSYLKTSPTPSSILATLIRRGTSAHVVQTVPAALLCFLGTSTYADAVQLAIHAGGDTDTTAAITGALAGSFYGYSAVEAYLGRLELAEHLERVEGLLLSLAPNAPEDFEDSSLG